MGTLIRLYDILFRIRRESRGAVSAEYAFLIVFISLIAVLGFFAIGGQLRDYFTALGLAIEAGTPPS